MQQRVSTPGGAGAGRAASGTGSWQVEAGISRGASRPAVASGGAGRPALQVGNSRGASQPAVASGGAAQPALQELVDEIIQLGHMPTQSKKHI